MKTTFRIAKNELCTLFYSPVAWLILIIFSFQVYSAFAQLLGFYANSISLGQNQFRGGLTFDLFVRGGGAPFQTVTSYLFLYVPLLTMGLISQEFSGGTIKLLFSSPVSGLQIVLGKFISMMIYGLLLVGVLLVVPLIISEALVPDLFTPTVLIGILGVYLLFCTYAAIGLFMSTLTSYQMIAALGTLTTLSVLNFIGKVGQNIDFIKDISYWLSISGRVDKFLWGLICSEDLIYFIIVTFLFMGLSVFKLESGRQNNSMPVKVAKYAGFVVICLLIGYVTSRPVFKAYYDGTENKQHTLTPVSQEILSKIEGDLTMTSYVNLMDGNAIYGVPAYRNSDKRNFEQYIRFKPEMKLKYVLFYDSIPGSNMTEEEMLKQVEKTTVVYNLNPKKILNPEQIHKMVDLSPEENRFVRVIETEDGRKAFLRMYYDSNRYPSENEISIAFKSLLVKRPVVAFITGHNERSIDIDGDLNYRMFSNILTERSSLVNKGFQPVSLKIPSGGIPEDVDILVIADPQSSYTPDELNAVSGYIERGGNLIVIGEPRRSNIVNEIINQLGVSIIPGTLVNNPSGSDRPDLLFIPVVPQSSTISSGLGNIANLGGEIAMPSAGGLGVIADKGYEIVPLAVTNSSGYWSELQTTNFANETPSFDPSKGETEGAIPVALALSKKRADREQKIIIMGDADCISNSELSINRDKRSANWAYILNAFKWLSNNEYPIDISRPASSDNVIKITPKISSAISVVLKWVVPGVLILLAVFVWIKRRSH
jgi:ABC-2 type transport system permease protein